MKRPTSKKLALAAQTLRDLSLARLEIVGGVRMAMTSDCGSCGWTYCCDPLR